MKKILFPAILSIMAAALCVIPSCDLINTDMDVDEKNDSIPETIQSGLIIRKSLELASDSAVLELVYRPSGRPNKISPVFKCGCISAADSVSVSGLEAADIIAALSGNAVEGSVHFDEDQSGTLTFEGLDSDTEYMAVAMVSYGQIHYYSNIFEFKTIGTQLCVTQEVDMGLSVKWAGWNIGATAPQEYGDYFAWGETKPWAIGWSGASKYKFYDSASPSSAAKFTKYVTSASYATDPAKVDGLSTLLPEDDAATVAWGGKWRMPTDAEKTELLANTTHNKYEYQGVKGYIFTSKKNGNAIFLPCTGIMMQGSSPTEDKSLCGFWTSSLRSDNSMAYIACNKVSGTGLLEDAGFEMDPQAESWHLGQYRWYGLPVRAVLGK